MSIKGYYKQLHFKSNDLELFFKFPVVTGEGAILENCPHVEGLKCSRAHELAPAKCITERKCEIEANKDKLFHELGISALALRDLDEQMRK